MFSKLTSHLKRIVLDYSVECIIWDIDGTLWQNDILGIQIKKQYLKLWNYYTGTHITLEEFDQLMSDYPSWSTAVAQVSGKIEKDIITHIEKQLDKSIHLDPDPVIVALVQSFPKQRHLILTNSSLDQSQKVLIKLGFKKEKDQIMPFEKIFCLDNLPSIKPDHSVFEKVQAYTQITRQRHLMIGDSNNHDILPAKQFGFKSIHIKNFKQVYGK